MNASELPIEVTAEVLPGKVDQGHVLLNFLGRNYPCTSTVEVAGKLRQLGYQVDARGCNGGFNRAPKAAPTDAVPACDPLFVTETRPE